MSVITTVTAYVPLSTYMWVPLTVNGPPVGPLIVPGVVGVVSPQSIVAEYSAAVEAGSGSVNVATVPVNVTPSVAPNVVPLRGPDDMLKLSKKCGPNVAFELPRARYGPC